MLKHDFIRKDSILLDGCTSVVEKAKPACLGAVMLCLYVNVIDYRATLL